MKKINLNQKKLISEGLMNLSIAVISIAIIAPILSKTKIDSYLLIVILVSIIIISLMLYFSLELIRK